MMIFETSSIMQKSQQCTDLISKLSQETNVNKSFELNKKLMKDCDQSSLEAIRRQLNLHERLYKRYVCGEMSQNNAFCLHLNHMKETRKNLLKQMDRMDMNKTRIHLSQ